MTTDPVHADAPRRHPIAEACEALFKDARREGMSISIAIDVMVEGLLLRLEERGAETATLNKELISVQSIYGAKTQTPLVDFKYGLEHFTLGVDQAREHAMHVLVCAEAAMMDAAVYRWLTLSDLGLSTQAAAEAVADLRRFRGDVDREDWRTDEQKGT